MSEKKSWQNLRLLLVEVLGSDYVYYQAPSKEKMHYPCIIFERDRLDSVRADNKLYSQNNRYTITYVDPLPTTEVQGKLLMLPFCTHDRHFTNDNLHHDVFTIYY